MRCVTFSPGEACRVKQHVLERRAVVPAVVTSTGRLDNLRLMMYKHVYFLGM
jgi:hypothetical protein